MNEYDHQEPRKTGEGLETVADIYVVRGVDPTALSAPSQELASALNRLPTVRDMVLRLSTLGFHAVVRK